MSVLMENPKISIIVPVYNVGKYVGQCMRTLTHQTISVPYEILAVNDGSTDNSLEVLHQYAAASSRIRIIDQPNAGVSAARTAGMEAARGEYLCFIDGDDYVAPNYLERLYRACTLNDADIACCYYYWHLVSNDILFEYPFRCRGIYTTEEALNILLRDVLIQSFLWCKMYRKELFTRSGVKFPHMCFEDLAVLHEVFAVANRVAVIDEPLYFYNMHCDSTLGKMNPGKVNDYVRAIAMVRAALEKSGQYSHYRESYHALAKKTLNNCNYFVLKLHSESKTLRGLLPDLRQVKQAIDCCCAEPFSSSAVLQALPSMSGRSERHKRLAR
ncbi:MULTISPECIES: glycosyltransferase [Caproicibacterium]|uniref:Glycosyltransferase n=1 Tax=Caproicibacterium argilliputei TaxID=3030016 RepID=A0AA97H2A3_9FIRM|nr:glycosyltransferase [Caproicibacterium argilliputei]WOC32042.1 glycosyltransferase [Caproicibacterium argilliputei]